MRRILPSMFGDTQPTRSYGMGSQSQSRMEGKVSSQAKADKREFYPLDDLDNSSETRLGHNTVIP